MEAILAAEEGRSPFNRFITDSAAGQRKVIQDYIARIRRDIVRALASEGDALAAARMARAAGAEQVALELSQLDGVRGRIGAVDLGASNATMAGYSG